MHRYPIIPYPKKLEEKNGSFFTQKLSIIVSNEDSFSLKSLETTLRNSLFFRDEKKIPLDFSTNLIPPNEKHVLIHSSSISEHDSPESYGLHVSKDRIEIIAPTTGGVFYAFQTLLQIISLNEVTKEISIPCCRIVDWPAFPIRGFMHDVGRNFISINRLKKQMQIFARYKINVFHWHLTDNPAFRIESRTFPALNEPKYQRKTRDPGDFYTYEDMHEFIAFCRTLNITVIPEIDVPGHSKYFRRVFKTKMNTRKGMNVLRKIFKEFLSEFSKEEIPYIHIGGDETHILNPKHFVQFITQIVQQEEREIIMWNPGLLPPTNAILHNWGNSKKSTQRFIDSKSYYLNNMELFSGIMDIFFSQPCGVVSCKHPNSLELGSVLCLWPDVNVDDESTTEKYNFLYPAVITFAERVWWGNNNPKFGNMGTLLYGDIESYNKFTDFEKRLIHHRDTLSQSAFFPYTKQSNIQWKIYGPFNKIGFKSFFEPPEQNLLEGIAKKDKKIQTYKIRGATINLAKRYDSSTILSDKKRGIVYAFTSIYSQKEQKITVWVGFETPVRSNREYRGIPKKNQWDSNGGAIWLNNEALEPPKWKNTGKFSYSCVPSWNWPHHEISYIDEEFFWTRQPYALHLKQGWNKLCVKIVKSYPRQNWAFTFIPLLIEDEVIKEKKDLEYKIEI